MVSAGLGRQGWCSSTPPSKATAGRWVGSKVGLFAITESEAKSGYADFEWFRIGRD